MTKRGIDKITNLENRLAMQPSRPQCRCKRNFKLPNDMVFVVKRENIGNKFTLQAVSAIGVKVSRPHFTRYNQNDSYVLAPQTIEIMLDVRLQATVRRMRSKERNLVPPRRRFHTHNLGIGDLSDRFSAFF